MTEVKTNRPFFTPRWPTGEAEDLSANGSINLTSSFTNISGNVSMTLADGLYDQQIKFLNTQGGAIVVVTLTLDQSGGDWVSFSLGANNKARLLWDKHNDYWVIMESKGLTKNL